MANLFSKGDEILANTGEGYEAGEQMVPIGEKTVEADDGGVVKDSELSKGSTGERTSERSEALIGEHEYKDLKGDLESTVQQVSVLKQKASGLKYPQAVGKEMQALKASVEFSGEVDKPLRSQLPIRKEIFEATLDEKQNLVLEIFSEMGEKQKVSEKVIADLRSEIEMLEAENSKLMAETGDANLRAVNLNKVLKAMEEKEATSSALDSKNQAPLEDDEAVCELESQLKWLHKEIFQSNPNQSLLKKKNESLQSQVEAKLAEKFVLFHELENEKHEVSEEIKALKEKESKQQNRLDFCEQSERMFVNKALGAYRDNKEKGEKIKNMEEEHSEWKSNFMKRVICTAVEFTSMKGDVEHVVETLEENFAGLESIFEHRLLEIHTKLSECSQQLQTVKPRFAAYHHEKEALEIQRDELKMKVQYLEMLLSKLRADADR